MTAVLSIEEKERCKLGALGIYRLPTVIQEIGREGFANCLLDFVDWAVGGDHCAILQLKNDVVTEVASAWHSDAAAMPKLDFSPYDIKRQRSQTSLPFARVEVCNTGDADEARSDGARKRQHIMICVQRSTAFYCLRILRLPHRERIPDGKMDYLREIADVLVSLVARHAELQVKKPNLTPALSSLEEIQECINNATDLSRREGQVCARILYGYSSCGIALDLGIGKETVMTYRKRSYQRIGIGSQRELLMWYLALWSTLHGRTAIDDVELLVHAEHKSKIRNKLPRITGITVVPALV